MKKKWWYYLLCTVLLVGFISCNNDDKAVLSMNGTYFSGTSASGNVLELLYSQQPLDGKEVRFNTSDGKTAIITLKYIVPGETYTSISANLVAQDGGYSFEGTTITTNKHTIEYKGLVQKSRLQLELNVNMVASSVTGTWNLTSEPLHIVWEAGSMSHEAQQLAGIISQFGNLLLKQYLRTVTFGADGNVTAMYKAADASGGQWVQSPKNLCMYYVKDNKLYLVPDMQMIAQQVEKNKQKTRALGIMDILNLFNQVVAWGKEGIPLNISENPDATRTVFFDKKAIAPFIPLLPVVVDLLPPEGEIGDIASDIVNQIITIFPKTTRLELGIELGVELKK